MNTQANPTSMSDANFFGRSPAPGVDIASATRGAITEAARGYQTIIHQDAQIGAMEIRRAVMRLAITLGNQSHAEHAISRATIDHTTSVVLGPIAHPAASAQQASDAAAIEAGANRDLAHPALVENLEKIETALAVRREMLG